MDLIRSIGACLVVFGLLGCLYVWSKRRSEARQLSFSAAVASLWAKSRPNATNQDSLRVIRRISLTPSHQLHSVHAGGRELLLCTHPHGCTIIASESDAVPKVEQAHA